MQGLKTLTGSFNLHQGTPIRLKYKNWTHYCNWIQIHSNSLLFNSNFPASWLDNLAKYGGTLLQSGVGFNLRIERISRMPDLLQGKSAHVHSRTTFSNDHPPSNIRILTETLSKGHAGINYEIRSSLWTF